MARGTEADVCLTEETLELCHAFYRRLKQDPLLFADEKDFRPHRYRPAEVDARFARQMRTRDRRCYTVLFRGEVIGEAVLKHIDEEARRCELGICLVDDSVKNRGFGTRAEKLLLRHAFEELGMESVSARALSKNARSCHVLEKAGFGFLREENGFRFYRCQRPQRRIDAQPQVGI